MFFIGACRLLGRPCLLLSARDSYSVYKPGATPSILIICGDTLIVYTELGECFGSLCNRLALFLNRLLFRDAV